MRYTQDPVHRHHNHQPLNNDSRVANQRRRHRTNEIREEILRHGQAEILPRQSLALLEKQFPESFVTSKDIDNIKLQIRRDIRKNMALVHATLARLEIYLFFSRFEVELLYADDAEGPKRETRLFIARPKSAQLYKRFNDVIVLS